MQFSNEDLPVPMSPKTPMVTLPDRMRAEILAQRGANTLAIGGHHAHQRLDATTALVEARVAIGGEGLALHGERGLHRGDRSRVVARILHLRVVQDRHVVTPLEFVCARLALNRRYP